LIERQFSYRFAMKKNHLATTEDDQRSPVCLV